MFDFDVMNNPEPYDFYLCQPNGKILYQLNGIDEDTASLTINLNNQYDLSFDYLRYIDSIDGDLIESNGYHNLVVGMNILVSKIGYFRIKYPPMKFDGSKEMKSITASSIDCELEDKDLVGFKINVGVEDSLENLVVYEDGESETLVNAYTGLPYDYIVFYNTYAEQLKDSLLNKYSDGTYTNQNTISTIKSFCNMIPRLRRKAVENTDGSLSITEYVEYTYDSTGENIISIYLSGFNNRVKQLIDFYTKYRNQLSLIPLAIEKCNCNWTIGEIDNSLVNKKFQFDVDGQSIYSFLTSDIAQVANCVFSFDLFKKKINVILAENIGKQSGVVIDRYNLLNNLEINCNSDNIYTRYNVSGGNNIDIKYVNFGHTRIEDLSYYMNARNEQNKRIYVSDELAEKYALYIADKEIAREEYMNLTKTYNQSIAEIDELKYRVPNDSLQNDWDSFSDAELSGSLTVYNNLLATLQSLYKEDYSKSGGLNSDGSINETYIKKTEYWYDYFAYIETIQQIEETIRARANGTRYAEIDDEIILAKINAYKTEWTLYGTVELENKITAYNNQLQVMIDGEAVFVKSSGVAKKWSELTSAEKTEYGNVESAYHYDSYMKLYNEKVSCQAYLDTLNNKIATLEIQRDNSQKNRNNLVKLIELKTYNRSQLKNIVSLPSSAKQNSFTDDDISTITLLYVDKNYSNENILTTSLDTTVTEVDIQKDLLEDAKEKLSIESQPQISFNAEIENLLCMQEFKDFDFNVGNYVSLEYYDNYYVTMRLSSMTFNPCIPENSLSVSFTNYIRSKSERSDIEDILGLAVGSSSRSSSNGGGSGSGNFGEDDKIDVTISNTMLSKLLNTEMFGTRVSNIILDTIKVNEINAKYAKFDGLAKGTTIIDGKCITTGYIIDQYYNGVNGNIANTKGSILNLETGYFNFGGGSIKYDGNGLYVKGSITADSGYIGGQNGFVIAANKMYSNGHNVYNSNVDGVYIGVDYISLGKNGMTYFTNNGTGKIGTWNINDTSIWRNKSSFKTSGGMYFGTSGLSISNVFSVDSSGNLRVTDNFSVSSDGEVIAKNANIEGDIKANTLNAKSSGSIACWQFNSSCLYTNSSSFGYSGGMYFGASGLSITNKFKVQSNGSFDIANGQISYNSSNGKVTFGSGVTLNWNQVSNQPDIPTDVNQLSDDSGQKWSTSIGDEWIKTCSVECQNLVVTKVKATTGQIGGWDILSTRIESTYGGYRSGIQSNISNTAAAFYAGCTTTAGGTIVGQSAFCVQHNGKVTCSNMNITGGTITIGSGDNKFSIKNTGDMEMYGNAVFGKSGTTTTIWHNTIKTDYITATSSKLTLESKTGAYSVEIGAFVGGIQVTGKFMTPWGYNNKSDGGANVHITSAGTIQKASSSSKRYKNHITYTDAYDEINDAFINGAKSLKPCLFRYNEGYIENDSVREDRPYNDQKYIMGLIAEDVNDALGGMATDYYYDKNTDEIFIEDWKDRPVLVSTLALAQDNARQIEELKHIIQQQSDLIKELQNREV